MLPIDEIRGLLPVISLSVLCDDAVLFALFRRFGCNFRGSDKFDCNEVVRVRC